MFECMYVCINSEREREREREREMCFECGVIAGATVEVAYVSGPLDARGGGGVGGCVCHRPFFSDHRPVFGFFLPVMR